MNVEKMRQELRGLLPPSARWEDILSFVENFRIFRRQDRSTVCVIWSGQSRFVGEAKCNPSDQFQRKIGTRIAVGRAWRCLLDDTHPREGSANYHRNKEVVPDNGDVSEITDRWCVPEWMFKVEETK